MDALHGDARSKHAELISSRMIFKERYVEQSCSHHRSRLRNR